MRNRFAPHETHFRTHTDAPLPADRDTCGWSALSPRMVQLQALLVGSDRPAKLLAEDMGLSLATFKVYTNMLYKLTGAANGRITLLRRAIDAARRE